jgi:D-alanine-D-alanine ligase
MNKKNILLLSGGGGAEHDVSLISAAYLEKQIDKTKFNVTHITIGNTFDLQLEREKIDFCIPCIHGYPGESGHIQSLLELLHIPYMGCSAEGSQIAFNKISTKLWLDKFSIPNVPFIALKDQSAKSLNAAQIFFEKNKKVFIKAATQGSSIGCYPVEQRSDLASKIKEAFHYGEFVLIEKMVSARELEVSVFEFQGKTHVTVPGEIICPSKFYSYEEKYAQTSKTQTHVVANDLSEKQISQIKDYALTAFNCLGLKHLSRIDFFLTEENEIFINEINTFPGLTPISMFPKMMENYGVPFNTYIDSLLKDAMDAYRI